MTEETRKDKAAMSRRMLLVSNSTVYGRGYLDHCASLVQTFFAGRKVLFVPYALHNLDAYTEKAKQRFRAMGLELFSVHEEQNARLAIETAEAIFIGGGNTFRLLKALYYQDILGPIRLRVRDGIPYLGTSAGANVACPTIKTTNDMPIVWPPDLEALGLTSFQINPHYVDADPTSHHMGETRATRIREFHEENSAPVVGLREGTWIRVEGEHTMSCDLHLETSIENAGEAMIFKKGAEPLRVPCGTNLKTVL
jgi:dipeptidase E